LRIHIPHLGNGLDWPALEFERLARVDRVKRHVLADLHDADVVLFSQCHMLPSDWRLETIASHPAASVHPERVIVYDERDRPWCRFPGVFVSMPRTQFDERFQRSWSFFPTRETEPSNDPDLLFSFVGSRSHKSRDALRALAHPDAVVEFVAGFTFFDSGSKDFEARRLRFRDVVARSRFVICPRGVGTSSIRLYEALASGRVPVIISDQWVAPSGPDWTAFSLRWPEGTVAGLKEFIADHDSNWAAMSTAALAAHRRYFADDVWFDAIGTRCGELQAGLDTFPRSGIRNGAFIGARIRNERGRIRRGLARCLSLVRRVRRR
jgi:hypothetical protein